jgi:hypothetical protein
LTGVDVATVAGAFQKVDVEKLADGKLADATDDAAGEVRHREVLNVVSAA